jgi:hypothetical protein
MLELYFHEMEGVCFKHRSDFFKIGWEGRGNEERWISYPLCISF